MERAYHRIVMGRYRWRTKLRTVLPWSLIGLVPKGADCGEHEWYRRDESTWGCAHCKVTSDANPWSPLEAGLLEALGLTKRLELAVTTGGRVLPDATSAELYRRLQASLRTLERAADQLPR